MTFFLGGDKTFWCIEKLFRGCCKEILRFFIPPTIQNSSSSLNVRYNLGIRNSLLRTPVALREIDILGRQALRLCCGASPAWPPYPGGGADPALQHHPTAKFLITLHHNGYPFFLERKVPS